MHGYYNKMMELDLAQQAFTVQEIPDTFLRSELGGKGLAIQLLLENNPAGVDALSPENNLIFTTGPLSGTGVWGSCRYGVFTKSPQTGYYSESYSGGTVAERMADTGYDAFVLNGRAETPVWVEISDEGAVFHPAESLRGLETYTTEDRIKAWVAENRPEAKKCGVIVIGPSGENQVKFAVIENDYWRSAGRTGVGAVMGSKNIKGIAFWGRKKKQAANPEALKNFNKEMARLSKTDKGAHAYKTMGTPMLVDIMNDAQGFPTRYWQKGQAEHRDRINAPALHRQCDVKPKACLYCFMACGRLSTIKEGRHKGLQLEGPEYETIYAFGGLCEVTDIEEIIYLNDICDKLGLDTMTAGNLAALTIEASLQGKVDEPIDYGDVDGIAALLEKIAYRRGIGAVLSEGIRYAAEYMNMTEQAVHVKGLEPAGYDPRVLKGMGLAYGTSDRGACHLRATFYKPELSGMIDRNQIAGKAEMFVEWEDRLTIFDCLILCRFFRDMYQWDQLLEMIRCVTGEEMDISELRTAAKKIKDNVRRFNIREGLTFEDDKLPKHFHSHVLPESGQNISEADMDIMLQEYYRHRGWSEKGEPSSL